MTTSRLPSEKLSPALVPDNPQASGNRCGFPDDHKQDSKFLLTHRHDESEEQGEETTSFFMHCIRPERCRGVFYRCNFIQYGVIPTLPTRRVPEDGRRQRRSEQSQLELAVALKEGARK
jgi:hypothetical protein